MSLLVVDDRFPEPRLGFGFPRLRAVLEALPAASFTPEFLDLEDEHSPVRGQRRGPAETSRARTRFSDFWSLHRDRFDAVWVSRARNARIVLDVLDKATSRAPVIYDVEAIALERTILEHRHRRRPLEPAQETALMEEEAGLLKSADFVVSVCDRDRRSVTELAGVAPVVVGFSHRIDPSPLPFEARAGVLYVTGQYQPARRGRNRALNALLEKIAPSFVPALGCNVNIVGYGTGPHLMAESFRPGSVNTVFHGTVPDLRAHYERNRVFAAPVTVAAGMPWKVTEAMSHGLPVVCTPLLAAQLGVRPEDKVVMVGDDNTALAEAIIECYNNCRLWSELRANALEYVARHCSFESMVAGLTELRTAISQRRGRSSIGGNGGIG
ncbi:MAG: glycosyltransferase [Arenicellales bacterium]